jgi:hypothetical protein
MKPLLFSLIAASALFVSSGTASAQQRTTTFNSTIIASPSLIPATFNPTFPNQGFLPAPSGLSGYSGYSSGYSSGFGNLNPYAGNGYTNSGGLYNSGYYYFPTQNYGGYYGNHYRGNNNYSRGYSRGYNGYPGMQYP